MGNDAKERVLGTGRIDLKFTSVKTLTLHNVHHVPDIRRNLVSGALLVQHGYKLIFESYKVVITRGVKFIGKGFLSDGLFKLNVSTPVSDKCVMNVECFSTWHQRLGDVNFYSIKKLMNLNMIPKSDIAHQNTCEICVEAKMTRKSFKTIDRDSNLLELIHSDVCDSGITTRGGTKYFVTFIDDLSKYCYLYLIKTKDEVLSKFKVYKGKVEN